MIYIGDFESNKHKTNVFDINLALKNVPDLDEFQKLFSDNILCTDDNNLRRAIIRHFRANGISVLELDGKQRELCSW